MKKILRISFVAALLAVFGYSHATDVKFDFSTVSGIEALGITPPAAGAGTDITSDIVYQGVTIKIEGGSTNARIWQSTGAYEGSYDLRAYSGATITISAPSGNSVKGLAWEKGQKWDSNLAASSGIIGETSWTGDASTLTLTLSAQCQFKTLTVTYGEGSGEEGGGGVTPPDPQPEGTVFDFDNKADELFPTMAGKRSSGSNDTYDPSGEFNETLTSTAVNGATVTISASASDAQNRNRLWISSPVLRMYDGTLTVKAPETIHSIVFTLKSSGSKFGGGNNTASVGTLTGKDGDKEAKWIGNANEIVFNIAKNTQICKIELGFEDVAPELVISGETPFEGSTTVTITGGDNIYYTIDGSDPKTNINAPLYSGPFTLTKTATVKAWDEVLDISAEKTFTKKETPVVNSIAEFIALQKGDKAVLNLNSAVCLYTWTSNAANPNTTAYVRDNSGALNFFNTGIQMQTGDVLDGSIILQKDEYNGLPEAIKAGDLTTYDNLLISSGSNPEARSIVINDVPKYLNDLVVLKNVSITSEAGTEPGGGGGDTPSGDIVFDFDNNADALFPSMAGKRSSGTGASYVADGEFTETLTSTAVNGATVTVEASPEDVGTKNRLWATKPVLRMYNGTLTITGPSGKKITGITFSLASAASSSRWGNNNSVDSGTLAPEGDKDKQTNTVTWTGSANQVVLSIAANTQIGSIALTLDGAASAPKRADAVKYYAKDDKGNTVQIYNNYHIDAFNDYSTYVNDKKYNVKGIVTVYKTTYEINTLEINETTTGITATESDRLDVNAPIYNLAGQQVNKTFKGVVIQNGKKFIQK